MWLLLVVFKLLGLTIMADSKVLSTGCINGATHPSLAKFRYDLNIYGSGGRDVNWDLF
jgi:hypothetical protein